MLAKWHDQDKRIAAYKEKAINEREAHDLIIRATDVGVCSNRLIPTVLTETRSREIVKDISHRPATTLIDMKDARHITGSDKSDFNDPSPNYFMIWAENSLCYKLKSVELQSMNTPAPSTRIAALARSVSVLLVVLNAVGYAQDTPSPPLAPAPAAPAESPQTEMQKWIATTDKQWQAVLKRDVTDVHLTETEKLKQQYVAALEAAVTKASSAGDLEGAVALRNEEKRFAGTNLLPEQDEATNAATVKQIRAAVRAQIARLDKETATRTKALHAKYDQFLAQSQSQLTKVQRLEDALLVRAKREEVAKTWLAGVPIVEMPKPSGPSGAFIEHLNALAGGKSSITPIQMKKKEVIMTQAKFKPPVEILVEAKTDSTNLRIGYAADGIIFNWEGGKDQLRIDGGLAGGQHKMTGGLIPTDEYVVVRWVVTPKKQSVYLDGKLRFEHYGDYSGIDKPVSVFPGIHGPILTVKSIKVKQLPPGTN